MDSGPQEHSTEDRAREALALDLPESRWPADLRDRYTAWRAPRDLAEGRFLVRLGIIVLFVTMLVEVLAVPAHLHELALWRLVIILPLQILALVLPLRLLAAQKLLLGVTLTLFAMIMLRSAGWSVPPLNAYLAVGPIVLFGIALPMLPFRRTGQIAYTVLTFASFCAMLAWLGPQLQGRAILLAMAGLSGAVALVIAARYRRLAERNFLLGLVADSQVETLAARNETLAELSRIDPLTGLANRRHALDAFEQHYALAPKAGEARVAAILLDIDHFKAFNDRWGHQAGDDCLVAVSTLLRHSADRHGGLAARIGGEEFLLLLRVDRPARAQSIAEELRQAIERVEVPLAEPTPAEPALAPALDRSASCTASLGIAVHEGDEVPVLAALIQRADDAMYGAKRAGRNQTRLSS